MTAAPPPTAWSDVLDRMQARADQAERFLAGEAVAVEPFVLPAGLGPLPADLQARAEAVLAATAAAQASTEGEMAEVALRMLEMPRIEQARPAPTFVDRSA